MSGWWKYLRKFQGADVSDRSFAGLLDLDPATLSRWKSGKVPGAAEVIRVAHVLGANPADALVASGALSAQEVAELRQGFRSLADIPLEALLVEVRHRLDAMGVLKSTRSNSGIDPDQVARGLYQ